LGPCLGQSLQAVGVVLDEDQNLWVARLV